jgi:hypothetical protein
VCARECQRAGEFGGKDGRFVGDLHDHVPPFDRIATSSRPAASV